MKHRLALFIFVLATLVAPFAYAQTSLTAEQVKWLKNRNNTIIVYPEKNSPPFVYAINPGDRPAGLSIDYLDLIAEKIGAKIEFLPARSRAQILNDIQDGRGDVVARIGQGKNIEEAKDLLFTETYMSVPAVLVVRKDSGIDDISLSELSGKRVVVTAGSAAASFTKENYPRVVLHQVTDDEIGLQQLVLGDVDAAIIDIASLSYFLSRQVLSSLKVAGHTGFSYELSFAVTKDKPLLRDMLDFGLSQISDVERAQLADKWVNINASTFDSKTNWFGGMNTLLIVGAIILAALIVAMTLFITRHHYPTFRQQLRRRKELREEMVELEQKSELLQEEMSHIKLLEQKIAERIKEEGSIAN